MIQKETGNWTRGGEGKKVGEEFEEGGHSDVSGSNNELSVSGK